jgi:transcriptional regulator with XRE-family HTH domain
MIEGRAVTEWKCVNCGRTAGNLRLQEELSQDPPIEHYRKNLKKINGENWRAMPTPSTAKKKKSGRGNEESGPAAGDSETDPETAILKIAARAAELEKTDSDSEEQETEPVFSLSDPSEKPPVEIMVGPPPDSPPDSNPGKKAKRTPSSISPPAKPSEKSGHEVRRRRKALGLSLPAFAGMMGKKPGAVSFLETTAEKDTPAILELKTMLSRLENGETIDPDLLRKRTRKMPDPKTRKPSNELREVRRKRLEILCGHFECPSRLAKRLSVVNPGTLWKILNDKLGMGDNLSRKIEGLLSLPAGWMDETGPVDLCPLLGEPLKSGRKSLRKRTETKIPNVSSPPISSTGEDGRVVVHISGQDMPKDLKAIVAALAADPRVHRIDVVSIRLSDSEGLAETKQGISP